MHFSTKVNEVAYLHKYLDDYEKEVHDLKMAMEEQERTMNEEKSNIITKLTKAKEKKQLLQHKIDTQETSSYYYGGGTNQSSLGGIDSANLKIENEHLKQLNDNQN